jgi:hypothetical protein
LILALLLIACSRNEVIPRVVAVEFADGQSYIVSRVVHEREFDCPLSSKTRLPRIHSLHRRTSR